MCFKDLVRRGLGKEGRGGARDERGELCQQPKTPEVQTKS